MLETELKKLTEAVIKNTEMLAQLIAQKGVIPAPVVEAQMMTNDVFSEAVKAVVRADMSKREKVKAVIKKHGYNVSKDVDPKDFDIILKEVNAL